MPQPLKSYLVPIFEVPVSPDTSSGVKRKRVSKNEQHLSRLAELNAGFLTASLTVYPLLFKCRAYITRSSLDPAIVGSSLIRPTRVPLPSNNRQIIADTDMQRSAQNRYLLLSTDDF